MLVTLVLCVAHWHWCLPHPTGLLQMDICSVWSPLLVSSLPVFFRVISCADLASINMCLNVFLAWGFKSQRLTEM